MKLRYGDNGAELLRAKEVVRVGKWSKDLCRQSSLEGRNDMESKDNRKLVPIKRLRLKLNRRLLNTGKVKQDSDHRSATLFWQKGPSLQ